MRLDEIKIERFRSFTDPQIMAVEPDVTCLVGKNESGKTTILEALHRLNPANSSEEFDSAVEYPRRRLARDRRKENLDDVQPITAWFSLEPGDTAAVETILGFAPPEGMRVEASRTYGSELLVDVICPMKTIVAIAGPAAGVDPDDVAELLTQPTGSAVLARAVELAAGHRTNSAIARATALDKFPAELAKYKVLFAASHGTSRSLHNWSPR